MSRIRFDCPTHGTNFLTGGIPCCLDAVADFDPSHYPSPQEDTMSKPDAVDPSSAGCWIDGHWGHYGAGRLIQIAEEHGWQHEGFDPQFKWEVAEEAEEWLNANVAPEGFSFGWHEGEFFFMPDDWFYEI